MGAAMLRPRLRVGIPITGAPMKILLETQSTDPDYNADCDYAVVNITPPLVRQIRSRFGLARKAGRQDDDLYELSFWGGTAEFYDAGLLDTCQKAVAAAAGGSNADRAVGDWLADLDRKGHAVLPERLDLTAHTAQRTECDQFVIRCSPSSQNAVLEVAWTAIPKHSDVTVTTRELPLAALEAYIQAETRGNREVLK